MDNSITRAIYKVVLGLCCVLTISLVFIICYEVVVRSLFGRPTSWAVELSSYAFLWLSLLCVAVGLAEDRHLRVEMITEQLPPRLRAGLEVVTLACTMAVFVLAIGYGFISWRDAYMNGWVHTWGRLFVPMVYTHSAAPIVGTLCLVFLSQRMVMAIRRVRGDS